MKDRRKDRPPGLAPLPVAEPQSAPLACACVRASGLDVRTPQEQIRPAHRAAGALLEKAEPNRAVAERRQRNRCRWTPLDRSHKHGSATKAARAARPPGVCAAPAVRRKQEQLDRGHTHGPSTPHTLIHTVNQTRKLVRAIFRFLFFLPACLLTASKSQHCLSLLQKSTVHSIDPSSSLPLFPSLSCWRCQSNKLQ